METKALVATNGRPRLPGRLRPRAWARKGKNNPPPCHAEGVPFSTFLLDRRGVLPMRVRWATKHASTNLLTRGAPDRLSRRANKRGTATAPLGHGATACTASGTKGRQSSRTTCPYRTQARAPSAQQATPNHGAEREKLAWSRAPKPHGTAFGAQSTPDANLAIATRDPSNRQTCVS